MIKHSVNRTQGVLESLRAYIISGKVQPGQKLNEADLAKKFHVSRTPLRQALTGLIGEGLITLKPNVGFSVSPLSEKEVSELYPIFTSLQCLALQLSFPFVRTIADELETLNENFWKQRKNPLKAYEIDHEFHERMLEVCQNKTLVEMIAQLRRRLARYEKRYMDESPLVERSYKHHRGIIEALRMGNEQKAFNLLDENFRHGMHCLIVRIGKERRINAL